MRQVSAGSEARPRLALPYSPRERVLQWLAILGVALGVGVVLTSWGELPDRIPHHVDWAGRPTSWGGKWILGLLLGVQVLLWALLRVLERYPHRYNYPFSFSPEEATTHYRLARELLMQVNVLVTWLCFALLEATIAQARGEATRLVWGLFYACLLGLFLAIALYSRRALKAIRETSGRGGTRPETPR
jgi:uncharacterized membrane protein